MILVVPGLESGFGSFPGGSREDCSRRIRNCGQKTWILASRGLNIRKSTLETLCFITICRPKISPPKVIYKVQSMPYKSLPLGPFWTISGRNFPTGVLQLLYPYQPANPLVESSFKALKVSKKMFEISLGDRSKLFCGLLIKPQRKCSSNRSGGRPINA